MNAWTKDLGDGTAKVYVKFPAVGEKIRISHQKGGSGSYETIYVKTTSSETMEGIIVVSEFESMPIPGQSHMFFKTSSRN